LGSRAFPTSAGSWSALRDARTGSVDGRSASQEGGRDQRTALNQERLNKLLETLRLLDIDPIGRLLQNDRSEILSALLVWSDRRRTRRVIGA
jgi:hypothetical protein